MMLIACTPYLFPSIPKMYSFSRVRHFPSQFWVVRRRMSRGGLPLPSICAVFIWTIDTEACDSTEDVNNTSPLKCSIVWVRLYMCYSFPDEDNLRVRNFSLYILFFRKLMATVDDVHSWLRGSPPVVGPWSVWLIILKHHHTSTTKNG